MKILSIDAEADGLYGEIFAIGGTVLESLGSILNPHHFVNEFYLRSRHKVGDPWVRENVLPNLPKDNEEVRETITTSDLHHNFWKWFKQNREGAMIVVDGGFPLEHKVLAECMMNLVSPTHWIKESPYPVHEVMTMMLMRGRDPDMNREEFIADMIIGQEQKKHNPVWDAGVSALCALKLLREINYAKP